MLKRAKVKAVLDNAEESEGEHCFGIHPISENTLIVYFGHSISEETSKRVRYAKELILREMKTLVLDIIPSYSSIHLTYDLSRTNYYLFQSWLRECLAQVETDLIADERANTIEIPVYYGEEVGLDLVEVAAALQLERQELIDIHAGNLYTVYAIGFCPGFAYLGNIDERIQIARKETPRIKVPAGSLGIADGQTAIYPSESPGGWRILGRTPITLIDYSLETLTPFQMGDRVRFVPITKDEFHSMGGII